MLRPVMLSLKAFVALVRLMFVFAKAILSPMLPNAEPVAQLYDYVAGKYTQMTARNVWPGRGRVNLLPFARDHRSPFDHMVIRPVPHGTAGMPPMRHC